MRACHQVGFGKVQLKLSARYNVLKKQFVETFSWAVHLSGPYCETFSWAVHLSGPYCKFGPLREPISILVFILDQHCERSLFNCFVHSSLVQKRCPLVVADVKSYLFRLRSCLLKIYVLHPWFLVQSIVFDEKKNSNKNTAREANVPLIWNFKLVAIVTNRVPSEVSPKTPPNQMFWKFWLKGDRSKTYNSDHTCRISFFRRVKPLVRCF